MNKKIAPSLMCANITSYTDMFRTFEAQGIEYLHIDVMDGNFVPNLQFGTDIIKQIRNLSTIPLDIHLMIDHPEDKLDWFGIRKGEYVSVHYESTAHVHKCLARIKELGAKPMLALNPATPLHAVEELLDICDCILLMTVNPGFAGQALIPSTIEKVRRLRTLLDHLGHTDIEIEVDGNVSFENATLLSQAGANIFVAGSSSVFKKGLTFEQSIPQLRKVIQ